MAASAKCLWISRPIVRTINHLLGAVGPYGQHDTYGYALSAQPGKSQGRPGIQRTRGPYKIRPARFWCPPIAPDPVLSSLAATRRRSRPFHNRYSEPAIPRVVRSPTAQPGHRFAEMPLTPRKLKAGRATTSHAVAAPHLFRGCQMVWRTLAVAASDCPECRQFRRRTPLTPVRGFLD